MLALRVRLTFYTSTLLDDWGVKDGHNLLMQYMNLHSHLLIVHR